MPTRSIQDGYVIGAGVDYISASGSSTSQGRKLEILAGSYVEAAKRDGNIVRPWGQNGYRGVACGGIGVATSDVGTIMHVSGGRAASVCREIIGVADNVSRVDLQATVRFSRDVASLGRRHEAELRRSQRGRGRPIMSDIIIGHEAGDTARIGSRKSNYHGRIYDKYRESREEQYRNCWRYEVECKGDAAKVAARLVSTMDNHPAPIAAAVYRWYVARGVQCRYAPDATGELSPIGRQATDLEGQLRWLSRQVAPVVARLLEVYPESDLYGVLFRGLDPSLARQKGAGEDEILAGYDEWTVQQILARV